MHRNMLIAIIALVIGAAVLTILQIWTSFLAWDVFVKILITVGILVTLLGFLLVIKYDLGEHKKLKDENYLD